MRMRIPRLIFVVAAMALAACTPSRQPDVVATAPVAPAPSSPKTAAPAPAPAPKPAEAVAPSKPKEAVAAAKPVEPASKPAAPVTKPTPAKPAPAAAPAKSAPAAAPAKPAESAASAKAAPAAAPAAPQLDLKGLEQRLKETSAIGVMTKLSLKNQVDDLVSRFRSYHAGSRPPTLDQLRPSFDLLLMKVLSLLQDKDPALANDIHASRDAIWTVLADPNKLAQFS